jgi:hypothetical protein
VARLEADGLDRGRLGRALTVRPESDIVETSACGLYCVQSACQPERWYLATSARCDCPDATQRGGPCKHSLALTILSAGSAVQARERAEASTSACHCGPSDDALDLDPDVPIPYLLTAQALAPLDRLQAVLERGAATRPQTPAQGPPGGSGEAACSACGQGRGVVYDGGSTRCYGCWHRWVPTLPATAEVAP